MPESLSEGLKRYNRDAVEWRQVRDRAATLLSTPTTADPWLGHTRTFDMINEVTAENPQIPAEEKTVSRRAPEILSEIPDPFAAYVNSMIARDRGNLTATADVIDPDTGAMIAENVPAVSLMALLKDVGELVALEKDAPIAPSDTRWFRDPEADALASMPTESLRRERTRRPIKMADETDRHPAQFHIENEDVPVATIRHTKYHGGLLAQERRTLVNGARRLQLAIQQALDRANASHQTIDAVGIGEAMAAIALPGVE